MNNDLISRQKAIDALADMHCKSDEDGYVWIIRSDAWARIDALPSVTPERKNGKWIGKEQFANSPEFYSWQCSVCGCVLEDPTLDKPYPFCPNCGSFNGGEQE